MSDSKKSRDDRRTKKELIAEIEDLRRRVAASDERKPTLGGDISRRDALKAAWVTPVILSVPLGVAGGAAPAGAAPGTIDEPTIAVMPPTQEPTLSPTTARPTQSPTVPDPGGGPTVAPTTAFPTAAVEAPLLSGAGAAVAAGALFGVAAKKLTDAASSDESKDDSDGSDDEER